MSGHTPGMTRGPLDTAAVVTEAVLFADDHGVGALTMRQLADRMGVKAMALYRHIGGRGELVDSMVAAAMEELHRTMTPNTHTTTTGSAYLRQTAHDIRDLALTHPWLIRLMVQRPPPARWLSRPLDSLACTEDFLQALNLRGYGPTSTVTTYRAFCAFLLGHLLIEVSSLTSNPGRTEPTTYPESGDWPAARGPVPPHRLALPPRQSRFVTDEDLPAEFERSLDAFVNTVRQRFLSTAVRDPNQPVLHPTPTTGERP